MQTRRGKSRLTIRSSRDRFAARLKWWRVPSRRAAQRSGLTQALGGARPRSSQRGDRRPSVIAARSTRRPHTPCSLKAAALRLWTNSLVKNSRAHRTRSVQLAQVWLPCPEILGPVSKSSLVSRLTIRSSRVRFAASSRCGKLVHLAAAATLLGLAQALDPTESSSVPTQSLSLRCRTDTFIWPAAGNRCSKRSKGRCGNS